jgi:hypothetical protein
MITTKQKNIINYLVICVNDFADRAGISTSKAFRYLVDYGGIQFLTEHYDIEHTLSLDDTIDDLEHICRGNGGTL